MSTTRDAAVNTVLGPVPASELGTTLIHEHLLVNMLPVRQDPIATSLVALANEPVTLEALHRVRRGPVINRDNLLSADIDVAISEAREFTALGGKTIVDVTLADIGRDPSALQRIARATGMHVIIGCGHYVRAAQPPSLASEPVDAIADRFVIELTEGIAGTRIKPGILGELGTSDPLDPEEKKVLRAGAHAHARTGVTITIHLHPGSQNAHEILDVLEEAGADLKRVIMGHIDLTLGIPNQSFDEALDYLRGVAARGCYLGFDTFGKETHITGWVGGAAFWCPSDRDRIRAIARLINDGLRSRLLISQDTSLKYTLTRWGGWGFGHILRSIVPHVGAFGITPEDVQALLVANPAEALAPVGTPA